MPGASLPACRGADKAKELGCDETEEAFDRKLKKIAEKKKPN